MLEQTNQERVECESTQNTYIVTAEPVEPIYIQNAILVRETVDDYNFYSCECCKPTVGVSNIKRS